MRRAVLCLLLAMTVIAAGKPASTAQAQEIKVPSSSR
jgi:hypothetical protein